MAHSQSALHGIINMSGGWPLGLEICNGTSAGIVSASSLGTACTSGNPAFTYGGFTQLTASSPIDATWVTIQLGGPGWTNNCGCCRLAIGSAGNEKVIATDMLAPGGSFFSRAYSLPLAIPAGTRISAGTAADSVSSNAGRVSVILHDGAYTHLEGCAGMDSIGFVLSAVTGSTIDPGGTTNTKGAYTQLVATTSKDYMGFMIGIDALNGAAGSVTGNVLLDIAIGGAGTEVVILPNFQIILPNSGVQDVLNTPSQIFWIPIPSGTRVAARAQSSNNTVGTRTFGCTLYAIYQ